MASFYNNYYRYYKPYPSFSRNHYSSFSTTSSEKKRTNSENSKISEKSFPKEKNSSSNSFSFGPIHFKNPLFNDIEEPIFEILGIQLYLDDIIILGLLFFLYQEGVEDEMLFIALILLLLG